MFVAEVEALKAKVADLKPSEEPQKKGVLGFMAKAASAAMDAVSSDFHIHFGEIEKSRRKEVMAAHGDVAGELLCCFDLDRLGSEDASILITDQWISFRSVSGLLMGTNLTLKVHWSWSRAVVRKDEHIEFSLREPADAPPLCVPWKPFFDDREAELHLLVEFLDAILQHNLTGGPEHGYRLLQELRALDDADPRGMQLLQEAEIGVDRMFGAGGTKSALQDVRSLLESDLILEKCRIAPPSRDLYHDILTTVRVLEAEQENADGYADKHRIGANLDMLVQRVKSTLDGIPAKDRRTVFMQEDLPHETPKSFVGAREEWMSALTFAQGHPKPEVMYIVHPLKEGEYLPLAEFDALLNEEKRHEFFTLVRALGARHIKYRNLVTTESHQKDKASKSASNSTTGAPAAMPNVAVGNGISGEQTTSQSQSLQASSDLYVESEYEPKAAPHIPEGLVWYDSQLDWQRLAADRLEAGLKSTRFVLKTSRREYFSQSEEKSVQKEMSAVYSGVKVTNVSGFSTSKESEKEEKQDTAIEIHITFAD